MRNKLILTIPDKKTADDKKTAAFPSRPRPQGGRRRGEPLIQFYDCGWVNHQALDASAIWVDHPVLKSPSYSTVIRTVGSIPPWAFTFLGVNYRVAPFTASDFSAYIDLLFNYPVADWTRRYRKIEFRESYDFVSDMRLSIRDSATGNDELAYLPLNRIFRDQPTYVADKAAALAADRWVWDSKGTYYKGLDELTYNHSPFPNPDPQRRAAYLGFSTGVKESYKLTSEYDPDASDVGTIPPSGNVDVFLIPAVGLWAAINQTSYNETENVVMGYQTFPRANWPTFMDADYANDNPRAPDVPAPLEEDYLAYQLGRSGMVGSTWERTGPEGTNGDVSELTYAEASMTVGDWGSGVPSKYSAQVFGNDTTSNDFNGIVVDFGERFGTTFSSSGANGTFYENDQPLLTAVIRSGGQTYYCWDIQDPSVVELESSAYPGRYRLSNGVNYDPSRIEVPPLHLDGAGPFFYIG